MKLGVRYQALAGRYTSCRLPNKVPSVAATAVAALASRPVFPTSHRYVMLHNAYDVFSYQLAIVS